MNEDKLERIAKSLSEENDFVSAAVAQRLEAARREAVDAADVGAASSPGLPLWGSAGLASIAAVALIAVMLTTQQPAGLRSAPDDGLAVLSDDSERVVVTELDVLEELEFLAWLEQESTDAESRG